MNYLKRLCAALVLTFTLAVSGSAGQIDTGRTGEIDTGKAGEIQTTVTGHIETTHTASATEIAVNMLLGMLSLI